MIFSNSKIYKIAKYVSSILVPALGVLYTALADAWGLPYGEPIGITFLAVTTFLNSLMGVSSERYDRLNNQEEVTQDDEG